MPRRTTATLAVLIPLVTCAPRSQAQQPHPTSGAVTGDLRFERFTSTIFGNTRTLRVLVPAGYDDPINRDRRYPVLYLNDGQELFDSATAQFGKHEWRVDETVTSLIAAGAIPPMIVVGIDNAGRTGRAHEYLPWADEYLSPPDPAPVGKRYPAFLVDEVMPFVNARFRTLQGPEHTGLGGASFGGLITTYTAAARPHVFGRLLVESPSLYVDSNHVLRMADSARAWPARVYLGIGTNELGKQDCGRGDQDNLEAVANVRRLGRTVLAGSHGASAVDVVVDDCATHNASAWAKRFPEALRFLYGGDARR